MTAIYGTDGNDYIPSTESGDFEIYGLGGDDLIGIHRQSYHTGDVYVDAGPGNDRIVLQIYGTQKVVAHGGAGNDIIDVISNGVAYGDAGSDTFSFNGLARPSAFRIADLQAEDKIDLSPYLKAATGWVATTNPFTEGFVRLVQYGADTLLQVKTTAGWGTMATLDNVSAASLTASQFLGSAPKIVAMPVASLALTSGPIIEGGRATFEVTLSTAATMAGAVTLSGSFTSSSAYQSILSTATIDKGATKVTFSVPVYEDAASVDGQYAVTLQSSDFVVSPRPGQGALSGVVRDNDTGGFTVTAGAASELYRNFTRLTSVRLDDSAALLKMQLAAQGQSTRELVHAVDAFAVSTTSVALTTYQFFTGKTPSAVGIAYLVNSPDNPTDLNDPAFAGLNTGNRYINFAANLGIYGEGKAAFAAAYGGLTFRDAVSKAYDTVIGFDWAKAKGIDVQLAVDYTVGIQQVFSDYAKAVMPDADQDLATKAGMIGFLIIEGIKAHVGVYDRALENFYIDLTDGTAQFHVDLVGVYGPGTLLDQMAA